MILSLGIIFTKKPSPKINGNPIEKIRIKND